MSALRFRWLALAGLVVAVWTGGAALAVTTDQVLLPEGDRLTGEIKGVARGELSFKTKATETIDIRWELVRRVTSPRRFEVEVESGERYFGSLAEPDADGTLRVLMDDGSVDLALTTVVRLVPIEATFWKRIDGDLSLGFNTTKSSDVTQFNFDADARYTGPRYRFGLEASSVTTDQESGTTSRDDVTFTSQRRWKRRMFTGSLASVQRNEELGVDLRTIVGGGIGRYLVQTIHNEFTVLLGAAVNREDLATGAETTEEVEGLVSASYEIFRELPREISLAISIDYFPGITDAPSKRGEFDLDYEHELVDDFFVGLNLYGSYESDPPPGSADSDSGVVASIGWSF